MDVYTFAFIYESFNNHIVGKFGMIDVTPDGNRLRSLVLLNAVNTSIQVWMSYISLHSTIILYTFELIFFVHPRQVKSER